MSTVIPAIQGKFGSTTYYEGLISARDLVSAVRPANETDEWASWGIEERMQRELDERRIRDEIVPYLAKSPDRFFSAVLVLVYKPNVFEWEPLDTLSKLPAAYRGVGKKIGVLTLDGGELIVLDGQHRVVALRSIITGKNKPEGQFVSQIPSDEIAVIFIEYQDSQKTRRIFNKVNRYAKPTSRADNIITSEDDGYAIIVRRLLRREAPFGVAYQAMGDDGLIVDWKNNTITGRSQKFTTVSVLYETAREILAHEGIKGLDERDRVVRPGEEELDNAYASVAEWWEDILGEVRAYDEMMKEVKAGQQPSCAERRADDQSTSLLFKPAGQIALVKGLIIALDRGQPMGFTRKQALARVNKIDWSTTADFWKGTIVTTSGRMSASRGSYDLAGELIAYLIGAEFMSAPDIEKLERRYNEARGYDYANPGPAMKVVHLPDPVA